MDTAAADGDVVQGAKVANIQVAVNYPIVSAYEFEFLKEEEVVRERLDKCTLYLLVQRPLTYFDNVVLDDGVISFEIADGETTPLACRVDLVNAGLCGPGEAICVETHYFTKAPGKEQPFRDVGAIKLFRKDKSLIVWWSPQKLLYEMLVRGLEVDTTGSGDPLSFLDFTVLYVGKAFDQKVWDRLTGHEKMQKILTVQSPVGAAPAARAPFEVSLILLSVVGLTDVAELPYGGMSDVSGIQTLLHDVDLSDSEAFVRFMSEPLVALGDEAMTREVEAQLIHRFKPEYNSVMFKNYPEIAGGMRSKGYTWTDLMIEDLPASLRTPHFKIGPMLQEEAEAS
ncbi:MULTISPECIES: hypothetical protein [unclassified Caulobacter]|jgi:hypothetical protein|uniref:hypothetical protein n=1 Tax=unclassified Caulobacter TaxID=2648921 RepID=UPI0007857F62|nr:MULTISPECIES: hypothetical protein [unclassified Caulobacter]AZS21812.1 hypothetical protein CSW63_14875 [Caulobacter sp. FWC26]